LSSDKRFWQDVMNWLEIKMERIKKFKSEQILFGNENLPKLFRIYNIITIVGKYHIHKCNTKYTSIIVFKIELREYFASLKLLKDSSDNIQACIFRQYSGTIFVIRICKASM